MNARTALAVLLATTAAANAAITGTTGSCTQIGAPLSALPGALIGPPAFAWDEQTNVNTASTVVNITAPGFYNNGPYIGSVAGLFDSHIIHFDSLSGVAMVNGSVSFSSNIAAVIFDESLLSVSDATFGAGGTTYDTGNFFRSYSANTLTNPTWLNIVGNTISFDLWALQPGNYIAEVRVLTHAVPTPGSLALMGLGGIAAARRHRK
jgi:hypothetical protein